MKNITLALLISLFLGFVQSFRNHEWQLELVQILFRNGVSAPDALYPNDPNLPEVWEEGLGQLTLVGQKQLYALGKNLKKRYSHFLSSNPHEVRVQSTYLDKCMNSALCLLASLYEPDENWEFRPGMKWQPIPVTYKPPHEDMLLRSFDDFANINMKLFSGVKKELKNYKEQLKYWTSYSGMIVTDLLQVSKLRKILFTEHISNHTIPDWAWNYWKDLHILNNLLYKSTFSEHSILRNVGGPLLVKMVNNALGKNQGIHNDTKIFIYSGQSAHLAGVLGALKCFNNKEPPFAALFLMEMLKRKRHDNASHFEYGIRLVYFNEIGANFRIGVPKTLILPGCTEVCPLENLRKQTRQWKMPDWRLLRSQDL